MKHTLVLHPAYRLIALSGEIDMSTSPEARKLILDTLAQPGDVLVDLSAVTYIDSSGVASLVEGLQFARKRGMTFALAGVSPAALNVLKLARLDKVFTLYADSEAYLAARG